MGKLLQVKADGDVPIPPDVRARLRWDGSHVVMEEVGDTIVLRRESAADDRAPAAFDWDEFRRHVPRFEGEPGTRAGWNSALEQMFAERGRP